MYRFYCFLYIYCYFCIGFINNYTNEHVKLEELPISSNFETKQVLKSLPSAYFALAELKSIAASIPNQNILINTLGLQEAKDSSAKENIITTADYL